MTERCVSGTKAIVLASPAKADLMPILEYACRACGHQFEFLKLPTTVGTVTCPACHGEDLERLLSAFAMSSPELSKSRAKAARTQQLQSKDHKDKQIADAEERSHHD